MDHVPLIRYQQRYLGYNQGTNIWLAGNHQMPTDKLDPLLHFAQPKALTRASLVEHSQWFEATAPVLHLQADLRRLALKCNTCPGCTCVLACVVERFLCNSEECVFNRWRQ